MNNRTGALYIRVSTEDQTELSPDAQKRLLLARRRTQEHRADCHEPDLFDPANSKRRVRELIEHLEKKFTLAAGQ